MKRLIKNDWRQASGQPFERASILARDLHPEGLDVERLRFFERGAFTPAASAGHIVSVVKGQARLPSEGLTLAAGVHAYLPPGAHTVEAEAHTELLTVTGPARGRKLIVRDEQFISASAQGSQLMRWILTPQYLSRRIFLRHDEALGSKSGHPVSWFHTTMFDVTGLPKNEDGESVFKMSYNSRTEFNVCYEVQGIARVRMANHPYSAMQQKWNEWMPIDGDSTYHLNEPAGGPDEESFVDDKTRAKRTLRNKHEVFISGGHVSLFCLFDPAPVGLERHQPGEYSDYEPLESVLTNPAYPGYQKGLAECDEMIDRLSLAKAKGELAPLKTMSLWQRYERGHADQRAIEAAMHQALVADGHGRDRVLERWMQPKR